MANATHMAELGEFPQPIWPDAIPSGARTTPCHIWVSIIFSTSQVVEIVTEFRARLALSSKCGPDGQDVLEASSESQEFSLNTPNMQPFLCPSVPPRGLWTTHRRVGVRHGRGPRASCTDYLGFVYISTRGK